MSRHVLLAPAKINLYLEIIGDSFGSLRSNRPDGFHELAMIMQTVELSDRVTVAKLSTDAIHVRCDHPEVPSDQSNLAYRAANLMRQKFPKVAAKQGGIDIIIEKNIPVGAGLAGGSTDAAAVLIGIDLMWDLGLTRAELQALGAELGSDIPFCISGGTAIATGRGEKISPLPDLQGLYVTLGKYRSLSVSTPWAYKTYRSQFESGYVRESASLMARQERVHSGPMVAAIAQQNGDIIARELYNDLEKVVLPEHEKVQALRDACAACPESLGAMMSGSGPTVFALSNTLAEAETIREAVTQQIDDPDLAMWVTPLSTTGVRLENL